MSIPSRPKMFAPSNKWAHIYPNDLHANTTRSHF